MNATPREISNRLSGVLLAMLLSWAGFSQSKLQKRLLFNNRIEILVPAGFSLMDSEMVDFKYSESAYRPDFVLTDKSTAINLCFQQQKEWLDSNQLEAFKNRQIDLLKKGQPEAEWLDQGMKTINGRKFGYFKLMSLAYNEPVYSYFFFTTLDNHPLILCFNCTEELLVKWKKISEEIANSVKIKE